MTESSHPDIYAVMNERLIPFGVSLELTAKCNLDCIHCYHVNCSRPELSTNEVKSLLDELSGLGTMELTLSGGEPLVRDDFTGILEYAVKTGGFSVKIFSNLTLMTPPLADFFSSLPLNSVETTLLGPDEALHDRLTGRRGSFEATLSGIELLRERDVRLSAKTIVMKKNIEYLDAMYHLAKKLEIPFRHDDGVFVESDGSRKPLAHQLPDTDLKRLRRKYGAVSLHHPGLCNIGKSVMSIGPDGCVYPCGPFPVPAGNVRDASLRDIWYDSPVMGQARKLRSDDYRVCRSCRYLVRCNGCIAMGMGLARGRRYPCRLAASRLRLLI